MLKSPDFITLSETKLKKNGMIQQFRTTCLNISVFATSEVKRIYKTQKILQLKLTILNLASSCIL